MLNIKNKYIFVIIISMLIFVEILLLFVGTQAQKKRVDVEAWGINEKCKEEDDIFNMCYINELKSLNKVNQLRFSLAVLKKIQTLNPKTKQCHLIAHVIANSEVKKNPDEWLNIFKTVNMSFCEYGFLHGAIEARDSLEGGGIDADTVNSMCRMIYDLQKSYEADKACSHILGHFVLVDKSGDVDKAVAICNEVDDELRLDCHNGLFMESIHRTNLIIHGVTKDVQTYDEESAKEQAKICAKYSGDSAQACWDNMPGFVLRHSFDPEEMWRICNMATTDNYVHSCYLGGVANLIRFPIKKEFKTSLCERFLDSREKFEECIQIITKALMYTTPSYLYTALSYCNNNIPEYYKNKCYEFTSQYLKIYAEKQEFQRLCEQASEEFKVYCNN